MHTKMVGKQHKLLGHSQALLLSSFNSIAELNMQHAHMRVPLHTNPFRRSTSPTHQITTAASMQVRNYVKPTMQIQIKILRIKLPRGLYVIPIPSSNKIMGSIDVRKDSQSRTLIKICKNEEKMSSFLSEKKEELNSTQFH